MIDAQAIRKDFPILQRTVHGKPLVYLDNAATSQKPQAVIQALVDYYQTCNANIHRGVHQLAEEATEGYEQARRKVSTFVNADGPESIVFTRNTTEAINLVAYAWARQNLGVDDEIVLTEMEHHSNLVPWQMVAQEKGARLRYIPIEDDGTLDPEKIEAAITERARLVCMTHMSNVLGTVNPVAQVAGWAHERGALMLVDGAQSAPHMAVDVRQLDCDFFAFSSHKMLGPTGVGVLYGRPSILKTMPPFLGGGEMIREVQKESTTYNELPWKYEAGTPNIGDVIAFGTAIDYLSRLGMDAVRAHEVELTRYALERLGEVDELTIYGPTNPTQKGGVVAFNIADLHPHDVGTILDYEGVAVRAGHHCCQVLMRRLDVPGTARASFYVYNTVEEVDALVSALARTREIFGGVARRAL